MCQAHGAKHRRLRTLENFEAQRSFGCPEETTTGTPRGVPALVLAMRFACGGLLLLLCRARADEAGAGLSAGLQHALCFAECELEDQGRAGGMDVVGSHPAFARMCAPDRASGIIEDGDGVDRETETGAEPGDDPAHGGDGDVRDTAH